MKDILESIDKIHTTKMGEERIRRNLKLDCNDVVEWCKTAITSSDRLDKNGKNWYAYKDDNVITINAQSFTVITAHKAKNAKNLLNKKDDKKACQNICML